MKSKIWAATAAHKTTLHAVYTVYRHVYMHYIVHNHTLHVYKVI